MIRWIAAFIGFYAFRFPGAILGFFVGWFADQLYANKRASFGRSPFAEPLQQSDFELNLLALSATVIKSDGTVKISGTSVRAKLFHWAIRRAASAKHL